MATQNNPFQYLQRFPQLGGDFKEPLDDALREQLDQRDRDLEDFLGTLRGGGRPHATRVVSHVDSQAIDKENADFIATGSSDSASQINAALNAILPLDTFTSPPAGDVRLTDGYYELTGAIHVPLYHTLEGAGRFGTFLVQVGQSGFTVGGFDTVLLAAESSTLHKLRVESVGDGTGFPSTDAVVVLLNAANMANCQITNGAFASTNGIICNGNNKISDVLLNGDLRLTGGACQISTLDIFIGSAFVESNGNSISSLSVKSNLNVDGDDNVIVARVEGNLTVTGDRNIILAPVGGSVTDTGTGNLLTTT